MVQLTTNYLYLVLVIRNGIGMRLHQLVHQVIAVADDLLRGELGRTAKSFERSGATSAHLQDVYSLDACSIFVYITLYAFINAVSIRSLMVCVTWYARLLVLEGPSRRPPVNGHTVQPNMERVSRN